MAPRTALSYQTLTVGGSLVDTGLTAAADQVNGNTIANAYPELTVLRISNTTAGALNATLRAGTKPLAESSGQGDLVVSVPASGTVFIGPQESARFIQADGSLSIDYAAGFTGTVTAFKVNRH
jgi:hypothetical protein